MVMFLIYLCRIINCLEVHRLHILERPAGAAMILDGDIKKGNIVNLKSKQVQGKAAHYKRLFFLE